MDALSRWLESVDPRVAERERFNTTMPKLRAERPGSKADRERKRLFAEEAEMLKAREQQARWELAVAENERRRERALGRRRAERYRAYQESKRRGVLGASGLKEAS